MRTPKAARTGPSISTLDTSWSPLRQPSQTAPTPPAPSEIRAQFRRAVEKFARVQSDLPPADLDDGEDEEDDHDLDDHGDKETAEGSPQEEDMALDAQHEETTSSDELDESPIPTQSAPRSQVPVQDLEYAESDLDDDAEATHAPEQRETGPATPRGPPADVAEVHRDADTPAEEEAPTSPSPAEVRAPAPAAPDTALPRDAPAPSTPRSTYTLAVDVASLATRLSAHKAPVDRPVAGASDALDRAGVQESDGARASHALERVIQKTDFAAMHIVGQFNLGFIIARRQVHGADAAAMDDLFIIDQHAADEKYNFEHLQRDTRIHSQRLLRPQAIELAPSDELVAVEHAEWLKVNGFEIAVDEAQAPGRRVRLLSKPMSKDTVFDVHDLEELLYQLREAPSHARVRCSKIREMLASRACRKSIMVGAALDHAQMRRVVRHMGEIEQPWNCPHGRPTMRHLTSLGRAPAAWRAPAVDWSQLS